MKLSDQASREMTEGLEHFGLSLDHIYSHHVLGHTMTDEELSELEGKLETLEYVVIPKLDRLLGEHRRQINQKLKSRIIK